MRRELAHRRLFLSLLRRLLRLATLHLLDAGTIAAAVAAAAWLTDTSGARAMTPALIAFLLVGLNLRGSYRPGPARRDSLRLVGGAFIGAVLALVPTTLRADLPGAFVLPFLLLACVGLIVERQVVDIAVRQAYKRGIGLRRALVIGRATEAEEVIAGLRGSASPDDVSGDQLIIGYVTPEEHPADGSLGTVAILDELLDSEDVSEIVVATSLRQATLTSLGESCFARGVQLFVIPGGTLAFDIWTESTRLGRWPAYHLHPARLELPALLVKRAADLVLASVGLVVALPLMLAIAIAIKVESRGPVFFRQRRVGLGGRQFMMWKFRSMDPAAEARQGEVAHLNPYADGRLFKSPLDPRVTRVGRFLRRFSLDELPQLFNVLAGDMSLVGPRPPIPSEVSTYEAHHLVRLSVVPGLTGPWQVNGRNLITDFEEVVRLERAYIETWSLRADLEIMLRTVGAVFSGRGAY